MKINLPFQEHASRYYLLAKQWFIKLSKRERLLIAVPAGVVLVLACYYNVLNPIGTAFANQARSLEEKQTQIKVFGQVIKEYSVLKARRKQIEEEYKEVASTDSPRAILENLIKSKLGLPPRDFTLPDPRTEQFGGEYEKTTASVQLRNIGDLEKLVDFLREVVHGPNPFMIKQLTIDKGAADRFLRVDLEASSIRKK